MKVSLIDAPVLIIAFNRPDTTQVLFDRIKEIKPSKIFVAVDGPRINNVKDEALRNKVIAITKNVDWVCKANYLIRENNVGCKVWEWQEQYRGFSKKEDRVIVVEDDIISCQIVFPVCFRITREV